MLQWLEPMAPELRYGQQVELVREVFVQQYLVKAGRAEAVKEHAPGVVRNPHDPDAQWSAKGQGKEKKSWMGYKVQVLWKQTIGCTGQLRRYLLKKSRVRCQASLAAASS